jgi:hypothetical protein
MTQKLTLGDVTVPKDWMLTTDKKCLSSGLSAYYSAMSHLYDAENDDNKERSQYKYAMALSSFSRCFGYLSRFEVNVIPEELDASDENPFSYLKVGEMKTLCEQFDAVLSTYIAPASKAVMRKKSTTQKGKHNAKTGN